MKVGVCGIACDKCPRMTRGECPNGDAGCTPRENRFCRICSCAFEKGVRLCFECDEFPCDLFREGPISYGFCRYLSGREA